MRPVMLVLTALAGALVALPVMAGSGATPSIEAVNGSEEHHAWSPTQVMVTAGGAVTLSNSTSVEHGVEWVGGPETPKCGGSIPVGNNPAASGTHWSGTCTFTKPGTYTFYCTVHGPEMTGKVVVEANGTVTTVQSTSSSTSTAPVYTTLSSTTPSGQGGYPAGGGQAPTGGGNSPLAGGAGALALAGRARASAVHGSLEISAAGAGGTLEVALFASRASLVRGGRASKVRVGRLLRDSLTAGRMSFAVALDAQARAALRRHHRLVLTVRVLLRPLRSATVTLSRNLVLRS
jgi:plastocyanin